MIQIQPHVFPDKGAGLVGTKEHYAPVISHSLYTGFPDIRASVHGTKVTGKGTLTGTGREGEFSGFAIKSQGRISGRGT